MAAVMIITRDGTEIKRVHLDEGHYSTIKVDAPSAGSHTYAVKIARFPTGGVGSLAGDVGDRAMLLQILKR